jgi:hypothetical protein
VLERLEQTKLKGNGDLHLTRTHVHTHTLLHVAEGKNLNKEAIEEAQQLLVD